MSLNLALERQQVLPAGLSQIHRGKNNDLHAQSLPVQKGHTPLNHAFLL
jgi:hypothetical protein